VAASFQLADENRQVGNLPPHEHQEAAAGGKIMSEPSSRSWKDVRMRGFQDRTELAVAVSLLEGRIGRLPVEICRGANP